MAGYKSTVKQDNPVSFHTFDLDSDALHGGMIIDEMNGNKNPMYTVGTNYRLEYQSLNPIETTDQSSIFIAEESKPNGNYSPVFANIAHNEDYNLEEWSLEFIIDKDSANRSSGSIGYYTNVTTPLIKKGTAINIYYYDEWNYSTSRDRLSCYILNGAKVVHHYHTTDYPLWATTNHYVITYGVEQIDVNQYQNTLSMFCNGRLVSSSSSSYYDSPPTMVTGDQWYIFGNGGTNAVTDYATEDLKFDQFAIYDYKLSKEQVSNHYRKTKTYSNMMKTDKPTYYWRMNDTTPLNNTMQATVGTSGKYYNAHVKGEPGPQYINDAMSTFFNNGGTAQVNINGTYGYTPMLNINGNYTIEMWFNVGQNTKGVLFTCHDELPNFKGVTIYVNSKEEKETKGVIQVNETITNQLHSPDFVNYTDGKWHHLAFKRSGTNLYLYLDGEIVDSKEANLLGTQGDASQVHLMNLDPYTLQVDGGLSEVAIYQRSLQSMQINSRYHFSTRHKIFGFTLLEGQGVSSTVRFYDNITGGLVGTTVSDTTGEYTFYTYSNKKLDIVALLPENKTTRYRIHAPIQPAEFDDPHI